MKQFRVMAEGADIGPGEVLSVTPEQYALRSHVLDIVEKPKDEKGPIKVRAREGLQFKVGEVIGLEELHRNLVGRVEPLFEPSNDVEKLAAGEAAEQKQRAKAAKSDKADK